MLYLRIVKTDVWIQAQCVYLHQHVPAHPFTHVNIIIILLHQKLVSAQTNSHTTVYLL